MLSPQRAFVIHLDSTSNPSAERLVGRVEHVQSGETAHFRSLADLFTFFSRYADESDPRSHRGPQHIAGAGKK